MARAKSYWLMKSEPSVYSIDDLARDGSTAWTGVRNYQARNYMRDQMKVGDGVLFYHSSSDPTGVAGLAEVSKAASPDPTAFDRKDDHFDPKSRPDQPTWYLVDVRFVKKLPEVVTLAALKANPALADMMVTRPGSRLSVQPVSAAEWKAVQAMARGKGKGKRKG
jgi:predicted RNA-binding protein with PUA-like domain